MSSNEDRKFSALNRMASRIIKSNPKMTHEQARRKLADHLERSQRKKEK